VLDWLTRDPGSAIEINGRTVVILRSNTAYFTAAELMAFFDHAWQIAAAFGGRFSPRDGPPRLRPTKPSVGIASGRGKVIAGPMATPGKDGLRRVRSLRTKIPRTRPCPW
jgi:hypothetical protein